MRAQEFYIGLMGQLKKNEKETCSKYLAYASDNSEKGAKRWTKYLTNEVSKFLFSNDLKCNTEYYKVDVIGWVQRKIEIEETKLFQRHLWDLKIAIELENNNKAWTDELVKLYFIKSPLKVIVSYRNCKNINPYDYDKEALVYAAKIMKKLDENSKYIDNEELLLIFGNSNYGKCDSWDHINFKAYIYNAKCECFDTMD